MELKRRWKSSRKLLRSINGRLKVLQVPKALTQPAASLGPSDRSARPEALGAQQA